MENEKNQQLQQLTQKKIVRPLFFVDSNQIEIQIYVIYDQLTGRIINVSVDDISENLKTIQGIDQMVYKFMFTKPNYEQVNTYKQMAMYWDNRVSKTIVNPFKLRNYLILNHLKSWKGVTNQLGQQVNLQIDSDGTLTQQSLQLVYKVNSSIIDVLMTQFESKIMLY